ncbi:MAG: type IV-A pilus assembly ATPase PilB [Bdellovibrio sp.]|nr:MAG: type IV-A pilus assembly ATPase PilB [Bdellovibrio sp.]
MAKKALGELLVRESLIDIHQLERAKEEQKKTGLNLTSALVALGFLKENEIVQFISQQYNLPSIDLSAFDIDPEALSLVPPEFCKKNLVLPIQKSGRNLVVAFSDPSNLQIKEDLMLLTRHKVEVVIAGEMEIRNKLKEVFSLSSSGNSSKMSEVISGLSEEDLIRFTGGEEKSSDEVIIDEKQSEEDPIIVFVNAMLSEAIKSGASDIHIEPYEKRFRIRFRIDGRLKEKIQPPQLASQAIISRIKVLSKLDIAERRRPQDGRLKVKLKSGKEVDFRVSTVPTLFGEKVVLRILDKTNLQTDLHNLGMEDEELEKFQEALRKPQGLILVTGPTGSGKTTTIYSAIGELNTPEKNIQTAEDPIEFNIDGINQIQVNPEIGFGFPEALRAFLRQDPEVIMVGEIRDLETANIAYKAASTGHLVISTLHTNDAASTVTRLIDMGVPNYMVAEATSLIVAQRLIKTICEKCKDDHHVSDDVLLNLGVKEEELHEFKNLKKGLGCEQCDHTGLKGRIAVFEVMKVTSAIKEGIFKNFSPQDLKRHAVEKDHLITLRRNALLKLKRGITTVEEVLNSTIGDEEH